MDRSEAVILPFPLPLEAVLRAVRAFERQFQSPALLHLRGQVRLENQISAFFPDWTQIGGFDLELGLVGLGDPEESEETYAWLFLLGPGEIRLATLSWQS